MKLKNNRVTTVAFQYLSDKGRQSIRIPAGATVEVENCTKILSNNEIENKWVEIVEEEVVDIKMKEAQKNAEEYMSATEDKKKKTKTIKNK